MPLIFLLLIFFAFPSWAGLITPPYDFTPLDSSSITFTDNGASIVPRQSFQTYQALKDAGDASANVSMATCERTSSDSIDYNNLCWIANTANNVILGTYNSFPLNPSYPMTGLHTAHMRDIMSWLSNSSNSPVDKPHKFYGVFVVALKDINLWNTSYSELLAADYYLLCNSGVKILIYQSRGYHGASTSYDDRSSGKAMACPVSVALTPKDTTSSQDTSTTSSSAPSSSSNSGGAADSGAAGAAGLASTGLANDSESAKDAAAVASIRAVDDNAPILDVLTSIKDTARTAPSCAYFSGCYNCLDYAETAYRSNGGSVASYKTNIYSCLDMAFNATKSKATTYYPSNGVPPTAAEPTDYLKNTGTASAADNASDKNALALIDGSSTALVARDAAKQSPSCQVSPTCKQCVSDAFSVADVKKCVTAAMALSKSPLPASGSGSSTTGSSATTGTGAAGSGTGSGSNGTGTGSSAGNCGSGSNGTGTGTGTGTGGACKSYNDAVNLCYGLDSAGNPFRTGENDGWIATLNAYPDATCIDKKSDKPAAGKVEGVIRFFRGGAYRDSVGDGVGAYPYSCPADTPPKPVPRDPKTGKPIDPCSSPTNNSNGSGNGATSNDIKGLQDATTKGLSDVGSKIDTTNSKLDGIGTKLDTTNTKLDAIANNTGSMVKNTDTIAKNTDTIAKALDGFNKTVDAPDGMPAYKPSSADSLGAAWDAKKSGFGTGTDAIINKIKSLIPKPSGSVTTCPFTEFSIDFAGETIVSPQSVSLTCDFMGILRVFILVMAAFSARAILFGR